MVVTRKEETSEINIEIDGCKIDQVNNFKYPGRTMTDDGRCEKAIIKRIEMARNAFNSFGKSFITRNISKRAKLRIDVTYGQHCCMVAKLGLLTQQIIKKLQAFEMWVYIKLLKISYHGKTGKQMKKY